MVPRLSRRLAVDLVEVEMEQQILEPMADQVVVPDLTIRQIHGLAVQLPAAKETMVQLPAQSIQIDTQVAVVELAVRA
jgi:hypothetical protein